MALSATVQWDIRTTGNDANGGAFDPGVSVPGTDFSQQNSAQIAYTDLVIGGTTTQLTSAGNPFTSAHVGNTINITGGTGFTTGRYTVVSVTGSTATMDRSVGTGASTGGTGNLGGSLLTIAQAITGAVSSNTIWIKAGTYTITSVIATTVNTITFSGYNSTHGDNGTKPLITTSTNSTNIINNSGTTGITTLNNLSLSSTASTRGFGLTQQGGHAPSQTWIVTGCIFDGFNIAVASDNGANWDVGNIAVVSTEIKNSVNQGINSNQGVLTIQGCYIHNNGDSGIFTNTSVGLLTVDSTISASNTGYGIASSAGSNILSNCAFVGNGQSGYTAGTSLTLPLVAYNCIFYGNANKGILFGAATGQVVAGALRSRNNAYGNNTNGNLSNWNGSTGDVTLTANPFTASGSGNYALNSTAGGGAACKGAGYPGVFPGGTSTGALDIGAVQTAGGGGGGSSLIVTLGMTGGIRG